MLFHVRDDPHEQCNIAGEHPDIVDQAMHFLTDWQRDMVLTSCHNVDPLMTVLREGGPFHVRGALGAHVQRLRSSGRAHAAEKLLARHPADLGWGTPSSG